MSEPSSTPTLTMSHDEFIAAYRDGSVIINFDPKAAAKFLSGRLLLPLFMMPVLGIGVALALTGWVWTGLLVIALGIIVPRLIKRGAPRFLIQQALTDESVYQDLLRAGIMQVVVRERA
jgi:hypothetical protein